MNLSRIVELFHQGRLVLLQKGPTVDHAATLGRLIDAAIDDDERRAERANLRRELLLARRELQLALSAIDKVERMLRR